MWETLFPALDRPFDFAAGFTSLDGLAAVVLLFALGEGQLYFRMAAFRKIDAEGDESEPLELGFPDQFIDLLAMQQELPFTEGIMIHQIAMRVGADVAMVQVHFAVIDRRITVLKVHAALAQRFHLGSTQDHTRLKLLFDKIIVVGLSVRGHHLILIVCIVCFGHVAATTAVSLARILL